MNTTTNEFKLDRAAYYILNGARLVSLRGQYGFSRFTVEIDDGVYARMKAQPLVDYQKYMQIRIKLKDKSRKLNNYFK